MLALRPMSETTRRRLRGIVLALAIEVLIALALLSLGVVPLPKKIEQSLSVFNVDPTAIPATKSAARKAAVPKKTQTAAPPLVPVVPPPPPIPIKRPLDAPPQMIVLSREDYAGADIGKLPKGDAGAAGGGSGADSGTTYGPGAGPGGQPLYNAEWYREPSHAEIAGYLPRAVQAGSAMIACRTIENYHVENCQSLGEEPAGTGLARAMRQAAWQFLVRPPRRGGKVLIGAWVRIRFDLTTGVEK